MLVCELDGAGFLSALAEKDDPGTVALCEDVREFKMTAVSRYEQIGRGYARTRREDSRLARRIHEALGGARTVLNVGAGAGSYEPRDRHVIAIEPSDVMAGQRPAELAPAIRARAGALPLRDQSVDAAMAVLSVHHWDEEKERGVREMRVSLAAQW